MFINICKVGVTLAKWLIALPVIIILGVVVAFDPNISAELRAFGGCISLGTITILTLLIATGGGFFTRRSIMRLSGTEREIVEQLFEKHPGRRWVTKREFDQAMKEHEDKLREMMYPKKMKTGKIKCSAAGHLPTAEHFSFCLHRVSSLAPI